VTLERCSGTIAVMGTFATVEVFAERTAVSDAACTIDRAFEWFRHIEEICSRFDPASELSQLTHHVGEPVQASELLYEAVAFAIAVADESGGAFDPTVGIDMERRGFDREHRSHRTVRTVIGDASSVSYQDVLLDGSRRTITLRRPLMLDLGAVAKGLAIDMAAHELAPLNNFVIDAGGDLFVAGRRPDGAPWKVGVRHPRHDGMLIDAVSGSNIAVCTSGDYERRIGNGLHHIIDARTRSTATQLASATVVAPNAMLADALATAAFVLGPHEGLRLLERQGAEGLLITPALQRHATRGFPSDSSILQDAKGASDDCPVYPAVDCGPHRGPQRDMGRSY
jgi:thiamine biosynthesis lipoprotein